MYLGDPRMGCGGPGLQVSAPGPRDGLWVWLHCGTHAVLWAPGW